VLVRKEGVIAVRIEMGRTLNNVLGIRGGEGIGGWRGDAGTGPLETLPPASWSPRSVRGESSAEGRAPVAEWAGNVGCIGISAQIERIGNTDLEIGQGHVHGRLSLKAESGPLPAFLLSGLLIVSSFELIVKLSSLVVASPCGRCLTWSLLSHGRRHRLPTTTMA